MNVCYNKLFKLMIDKSVKKTDLLNKTGMSKNTLSKFSKNEYVSMEVLVKVCRILECDIGDIMEILPAEILPAEILPTEILPTEILPEQR